MNFLQMVVLAFVLTVVFQYVWYRIRVRKAAKRYHVMYGDVFYDGSEED